METPQPRIRDIKPENLLIDLQNPRYDPREGLREALQSMVHEQGTKLVNLAEDIVDKGLNPSELPIVTPTKDAEIFTVLEGNRRIAALRLLQSRDLRKSLKMRPGLAKRLDRLAEGAETLPEAIPCVVTSREDAHHWILLRHTGEYGGVGVIPWDAKAAHRFRGSSPALQAIDLVEKGGYLDDETKARLPKIAITNIERVLGTPDARKLLSVDVKDGQLILVGPQNEALGRLALLVVDVVRREVKVTDLDTKDQRVEYAQGVAKRPLPRLHKAGSSDRKATSTAATDQTSGRQRTGVDRRTLIPGRLKMPIQQNRINRICRELQRLNVRHYTNSCAVMLRVFVEMSLNEYARRFSISLRVPVKSTPKTTGRPQTREMTMRQELDTVADHLEQASRCTRDELYGIRTIASNRNHVLSVDSWHAYVHNRHFNPTAEDLITCWDNIQPFVEGLLKF